MAPACVGPVLDAGCAFGMLSKYLGTESYTGVDWSKLAVQEARRLCPERLFLWGDALSLGEGWHKAANTVVAMQFLEHFTDPQAVFAQLRKYARQRVILTVPRGMPKEGNTEGHLAGWEDAAALIDLLAGNGRMRAYELECDPAHIGVVVWW